MFSPEHFAELYAILFPATMDTLYMVAYSGMFSIVIGTLIGVVLFITSNEVLCKKNWLTIIINKILGIIVNIGRSIPFIILIIAAAPLTRIIVGTFIGTEAAAVSLTIAAIPFVARLTESTFAGLDKGVVEASVACGASLFQTIYKVLIPETLPVLILNYTVAIVNLIAFSAMAGVIGGGGLGDVAIRRGLQHFRTDMLIGTIIILVVIVQIVQLVGNVLAKVTDKR
ncbi:MAG: ABC transporter permease [Defluviitaleaceae bacterium]|nr:ABC transporter permease [Defluviitaleaceae bacterium]MCL2263910.1 ABC transporter permease [Defluviitaleaceae bacterium]